MSPIRLVACTAFSYLVFSCLLATPVLGYIVFLKDGSQVQTKEKYRIEGDQAVLVLPSGTETSISADEIDIAKTEEVNTVSYGTATLIEGVGVEELPAPPVVVEDRQTLSDLARQRRDLTSAPETVREVVAVPDPGGNLPRTAAGYVDLSSLPRRDLEDRDVQMELVRYLTSQGFDRVVVYQGTAPSHPLLEITVNSEGMVFQALRESANLLNQMRERFPDQVEALDLYLTTENQQRAGQFILGAEQARDLTSGAISPESFFLRYVEF